MKKSMLYKMICTVLLCSIVSLPILVACQSGEKPSSGTSGAVTDAPTEIDRTDDPGVTDPPATTAPAVTDPPVTVPPVTDPPATTVPAVTDPPATEPPVTEPPVTEPPVTEPPVTKPPVTEPPVTKPPVTTAPPETEPPVVEEPFDTDKTAFTLKTGDSVMKLEIKDGDLYLTDLHTERGGVNHANASGQAYSLPSQYKIGGATRYFTWQYVGYQTVEDAKDEYRRGGYRLRFKESKEKIYLDLYVTAHRDFDGPFELTAYLVNESGSDIRIIPASYFRLSVKGEATPTAWTFRKESGLAEGAIVPNFPFFAGTGIYKRPVTGNVSCSVNTNQDFNQGGDLPMMYLDYGGWGTYFGMEWSNGTLTASKDGGEGGCSVSAKLGTSSFETTLPKGDSFYLPTIYVGIYDGDVDEGSNVFKRWFLYNKAPDILLEDENEPLVQQDMQIGFDAAKYGIEAIKWDYGWWSNTPWNGHAQWRTNEGLLEVHNSAYLGVMNSVGAKTLAEFVAKAKAKGLTLTTYILTHDTRITYRSDVPTSKGRWGHPEWFSNRNVTGAGQSADFGNVDCVEFFKDYMLDFFKQTGVTTWRSDFEPICRSSDKKNRHDANGNDVQYWCTVGFRDLVNHLYDNLDYFRYESCSSGGSMKDLFTATLAVVINCDDSANFQSLKTSFYDSSYVIPAVQLQLPTNAGSYTPGSAQYTGFGDHDYGLRSQMVGAVMLSNWAGTQQADRDSWQRHLSTYKSRIRPLQKYGDLYHVLPRPDGVNWDGFFYADADAESSTKGCLMIFKPSKQAGDSTTVKLRGLDPDVTYTVAFQDHTEQNCEKTGAELMEQGLTVTFTEDLASDWVWICA